MRMKVNVNVLEIGHDEDRDEKRPERQTVADGVDDLDDPHVLLQREVRR